MPPFVRTLGSFSLACLVVGVGSVAAQGGPSARADTTPPAAAPAPAPAPAPAAPKFTGYAEASYTYGNEAVGGVISGRLYDRYSNAFELNHFELVADRPVTTTKLDAGVHGNFIVGQNASVLHSIGAGGGAFQPLGPDGDVTQLYVTLNVPTKNGNGVQFKMGKMVTFMGVEVIEDEANPVWSEGNQFIFLENFTSTGLEVDYKTSNTFTFSARVDNGWDRIVDTTGHKDFMADLAFTPDTVGTSLSVVPYIGAQEDGSSATREGVDVVFSRRIKKLTIWLQGDYGEEGKNAALPDSTTNATWWGVGGWLTAPLSPTVTFAARGDYTTDTEGARTAGTFGLLTVFAPGVAYTGFKLWSLTGDLNITTFPNVLVRPEVRFDHASYTVFNGKGSQFSGAVSVAYQF